jgi:hypothetical protein
MSNQFALLAQNNNNNNDNNNSPAIPVATKQRLPKPKELALPANWAKKHYASLYSRSINGIPIAHNFIPYQLSNAVLQYLLKEKKISFDARGGVKIHDFPSLVYSENTNVDYDPRAFKPTSDKKTQSTRKLLKFRELFVEVLDEDKVKIGLENLSSATSSPEIIEQILETPGYLKRIKKYLPHFITGTPGNYLLRQDVRALSDLGLHSSHRTFGQFIDEVFVFDQEKLAFQKFILHRFFEVNGKQYLLFGYPSPAHMIDYYIDELHDPATGINPILQEQSRNRLTQIRECWNALNPSYQLNLDGSTDYILTGLLKDKHKEKGHLQYVLGDKVLKELEQLIFHNTNINVHELLSRGDTRIKYVFHIFEIHSNPSNSNITLESPIKRIGLIRPEHDELLHKVKILIKTLIYEQQFFQFQSEKERTASSTIENDNLLIYATNGIHFCLKAEYIDPLSNFFNYYYLMNNIYQIDDLINGVSIWQEIKLLFYSSYEKLNIGLDDDSSISRNMENDEDDDGDLNKGNLQSGGGFKNDSDYKDFLGNSGNSEIILFNIKTNRKCEVILKKGTKYYFMVLSPNLSLAQIETINKHIQAGRNLRDVLYSTSSKTSFIDVSKMHGIPPIFKYKVWLLSSAIFNENKMEELFYPVTKVTFTKPLDFYNNEKLALLDLATKESMEIANPGFFIPFIGKNILYSCYLYLNNGRFRPLTMKPKLSAEIQQMSERSNVRIFRFDGNPSSKQQLKDSGGLEIDIQMTLIDKDDFDYLVLYMQDENQNKKVIWLIPKIKIDEIGGLEALRTGRLTLANLSKYLANPFSLESSEIPHLKMCLEIIKAIVIAESESGNPNINYKIHLFYKYSTGCFHLHLSDDKMHEEPSKGEGNISRLGRTMLLDRYLDLQKESYYNNNNNTLVLFQTINYSQAILTAMTKLTSSPQYGGDENDKLENELNRINFKTIKSYIHNNDDFIEEQKILNVYENFEKIITQHKYKPQDLPNLLTILRSEEIINNFFEKNDNILIMTNLFNHLLPLLYKKVNGNISLLLFLNKKMIDSNNSQLFLEQKIKKTFNIESINGSYEINLMKLLYQKIDKKQDTIIISVTNDDYLKNNFIMTLLIAIENINKNGKIIIRGSFPKKIDNQENYYAFVLSHFKNYRSLKFKNLDYLKSSSYIILENFISENVDMNKINQLKLFIISELKNDKSRINFDKFNFDLKSTDMKRVKLFIDDNNNRNQEFNNDLKTRIKYYNYQPDSYMRMAIREIISNFNSAINYLEQNKIPYNKYYLSQINNYYETSINNLFSLSNPIKNTIIRYNKKSYKENQTYKKAVSYKIKVSKKTLKKNNKTSKKASKKLIKPQTNKLDITYKVVSPYTYNFCQHIIEKLSFIKNLRKNIITLHGYEYLAKVSKITEDFTRGLSSYLDDKFKLPHKPSNAFVKIWEIYTTFNLFDHRKKTFNTFHFCEAPGQFIWSTEYFIKKKLGYDYSFNWHANSLNHKHPKNIELYGKVFGDDYGFIKKYPERWLYGKDNTGDITLSANIRHFREQIKQIGPQDIVTGDAGLLSSEIPLIKLQLLEFAQICMVAATSSLGGHCVVKHFTPFLNSQEDSVMAGGLFVNMIYLYSLMFEQVYLFKPYTSKPSSGEFYVIGKKFVGVSDSDLDTLLSVLDNFHLNQTFFNKNKINDSFVRQVFDFVDKMSNYNIQTIEKENFFMTCLADKDDKLRKATNCMNYLNPDKLEEIQNKRFKEWTRMYEFV